MVVLREESDAAQVQALVALFKLTMRESEVLHWVIKGKTNRDIGDILGAYLDLGVDDRSGVQGFQSASQVCLGDAISVVRRIVKIGDAEFQRPCDSSFLLLRAPAHHEARIAAAAKGDL